MPIKFQCVHCGAPIKAPDTHEGQKLPCPKCGQPVVVKADPVAPPPASDQPNPPPVASAPPAVAPPPAQVFAPQEPEEDDDVIPEIVTRDAPPSAPPALDFVAPAPGGSEPYASPRTRSARVSDVELQNVRVVDVRLRWSTVFWLVFQFYVCMLALSMVVGLAFFILSLLFALVGVGVFGAVSWLPLEWFAR